ncbi:MAG: hypothetical protein LIP06_13950 [Tannerellaceae bacterium]|nr:hypothetical protein [Tannerellaceae bacterium]
MNPATEELVAHDLEELNDKIEALEQLRKNSQTSLRKFKIRVWSASAAVLLIVIGFSVFCLQTRFRKKFRNLLLRTGTQARILFR